MTDNSGGITKVRTCLGSGSDSQTYVAHVTVGLYADAWPTDSVRRRLTAFAQLPLLPLKVTHIGLYAYQASSIGGRLACLATFDLHDRRLRWQGAQLFESEHLT